MGKSSSSNSGGDNPYDEMAQVIEQGSQMEYNATQQAIQVSEQEYNQSMAFLNQQYTTAQQDLLPYQQIGVSATQAMYELMGLEQPTVTLPANAGQDLQNYIAGQQVNNTVPGTSVAPGQSVGGTQTASQIGSNNLTEANSMLAQLQNGTASYSNPDSQFLSEWQSLGLPVNGATGGGLNPGTTDPSGATTGTNQQALDYLQGTPGYQFDVQQGMNAVQNSAAASGTLNSGSTLKALEQYGQGMAQNVYSQQLGQLSNLMNTGESAAAMQGSQAMQTGEDQANLSTQEGNTIGSGLMEGSSVLANGLIGSQRWNILGDAYSQEGSGGGSSGASGAMGMLGQLGGLLGGMGGF